MAFWGVEVKCGKPISHPPNNGRGRLHISQATLGIDRGIGASVKNSVVQCNVGNKSPVFLCSLSPGSSESCQLHLEFDEVDEVIFSVIGPRSVHLTGYYLGSGQRRIMDDESESYGEDIRDTETERSDDDDQYEDSFIDDGDEKINPSSPCSSDREETSDKRTPKSERSNRRRLRKKYQHIESDDDSVSLKQQRSTDDSSGENGMDSDAEDACPISSLVKPKPYAKRRSHTQQKVEKENSSKDAKKDDSNSFPLSERKSHAAIDSEPKSQQDKINPQIDAKLKKSKTQSKEAKGDSGCVDGFFFGNALKWNETKKNETKLEPFGQSFPNVSEVIENNVETEKKADSKLNSKPKKKRKQRAEEKVTEVDKDNHNNNVIKEDKSRQDDKNTEKLDDDQVMPDMRHQKKGSDGNSDSNANHSGDENLSKKKKKRKKTDRVQENGPVSNVVPVVEVHMEKSSVDIKNGNVNEASGLLKTCSNKLVIEELEPGKPDGKIASTGKKISIYYTGKVKDSGEVFKSNVNGSPAKFRLGGENVLGDWTVGLDGMRVGEKRKVIVPPSLSFENKGDQSDVPPNCWLEYDVELLKVR